MKKVIYIIIGLVVLYVILAFIGPKHIKVEKTISINKPAELVKQHTSDYKFFHDKWSPWTELDTAMKTTYIGSPGQVGHRYEWSGNSEVRSGAMEIMAFNGDSINQKLSFEKRHDTKTYYIVRDHNGATDFTWGLEMDVPFMFRPMMLFTDMGMNKRFENGVNNLKKVMEEMKEGPTAVNYDVKELNWEHKTYLGKRKVIDISNNNYENMVAFMMETYPKLFGDLEKDKITPSGPATAVYYTWDDKQTDMAALAPVEGNVMVKGWEKVTLPAAKALMVTYVGPDAGTMAAHDAIMDHIKVNNLEKMYVVEEYLNHHTEKDSTKWITNIYYLLK